jgi:hypothetical protein
MPKARSKHPRFRDDEQTPEPTHHKPRSQSCGGVVYGLGLIGALVWFWRRAETPGEHATGILKAIVWPAILVYYAFKALPD